MNVGFVICVPGEPGSFRRSGGVFDITRVLEVVGCRSGPFLARNPLSSWPDDWLPSAEAEGLHLPLELDERALRVHLCGDSMLGNTVEQSR